VLDTAVQGRAPDPPGPAAGRVPGDPRAPFRGGDPGGAPYRSLAEVPEPVDLVDVFRPSEEAPAIAEQAVAVGAKALWLQQGIRSPEARRIATEAGLDYVEDRCTGAERRWYGITKEPATGRT
jgi:pyruvate/2-oxoglutarate dehydrogenase complex dihydrolipoamide acyltransferase (E2) component